MFRQQAFFTCVVVQGGAGAHVSRDLQTGPFSQGLQTPGSSKHVLDAVCVYGSEQRAGPANVREQ